MICEPRIVTIKKEIGSVNDWMYKHWRAYTKVRDCWMLYLRHQMRQQTPPDHKVEMVLTSYRTRLIDFANLVAGSKPIPDCLKRLGYIKDDSPKYFHCEYRQHRAPQRLRCTVLRFITPVPT